MYYKRVNTSKSAKVKLRKDDRRPLIVPLMEYICGVVTIILAIWLTIKVLQTPNDDGIIGIFAFIIVIALIVGYGILLIIVGYKRRKW